MIRINLLPVREARRQASIRRQGVILGIAAGAGVALSLTLHMWASAQVTDVQRQIAAEQKRLAELKETKKEVDEYRKREEEIKKKLDTITQLESDRTLQVRIFADIATRIPERMWLQELALKKGRMMMVGVSIDAEIVAEFLASLGDSPLFYDVELQETRLREQNGLKLSSFKVVSGYGKRPEPPAPPASSARGARK
jgi:type IV pilus assembly protein PilN